MRGQKYELLQLIVQGNFSGKRDIGRRRVSWLKTLNDWFNCNNLQLFRGAVKKVQIAVTTVEYTKGTTHKKKNTKVFRI